MTSRSFVTDMSRFARRLRYLSLLLVPGMMANALALTAPGAVPALLGNTAAFALALRLPPAWSLLATLPLGAVTGEWRWMAYTLLATAWLWLLRQTRRGWLTVGVCWALPLSALAWLLLPAELRNPLDQSLGVLVLLLGSLASLALASMIDRTAVSGRTAPLAPLANLLSARVALVVLGPTVVLLLAGLQVLWQSRATEAAARLHATARDFATEALLYVESQRNIIRFAAADTRLPGKLANLPGLHQAFPGFLTLLISDAKGDIVYYHAPHHSGFGGNVADRGYFREPRRDGRSYLSDVFQGRGFGNDLLVALSAPHRDGDGAFAGVVQGALSLGYLSDRLQAKAATGDIQFGLIDRAGNLVAGSPAFAAGAPAASIAALQAGPLRRGLQLAGNEASLWQEERIAPLGWRLVMIDGIATLRREAMVAALVLAAACLLLVELLRRHAHRVTRPLSKPLQTLLAHIRQVDLTTPTSMAPLQDRSTSIEFAELNQDFNLMQARLVELSAALKGALDKQERLNRDLELRVAERTRELRMALAEAERLARAKSEFLANMSHELRTPLTAILGYAERALPGGEDPADATAALEVINRNGRHLLGVVNDILDASRLDAGQMRLERLPVPVVPLLREVFLLFEAAARAKALTFALDLQWPLPASVPADPQRLRQTLINLIGNAIKFTEAGEVRLTASAADGELRLAIRDTGIGMTPAQQERLFRAFEQADASTSRRFGGSGLGLYLSQAFIGQMQGRLDVDSVPGEGSCFSVRLPLDAATVWLWAPPLEQPTATTGALPRLRGRVLVVDDVDDLRQLMGQLVGAAGLDVATAANGHEALDQVAAHAPDLVLLDMHMPVMDGVEAVRRMRAAGYAGVVVALTADVLPENTARFLAAGCTATLAKPVDRARLYSLLARELPARHHSAAPVSVPPALQALRERFRQRLGEDAECLQALDDAQDVAGVRELLHAIKGSAGTFGFPDVSTLAASAERAVESDVATTWAAARDALLDRLRAHAGAGDADG